MKKITCTPPNAIVFAYDPTSKKADTPEYVAGNTVNSNEDCISIATQAEIDGEVTIFLSTDQNPPPELHRVFHGSLRLPGKRIVVGTAHLETLLELEVGRERVELGVWVDDAENPASIFILVDGCRE